MEEPATSISRVVAIPTLKADGALLRNFSIYVPIYTALRPRKRDLQSEKSLVNEIPIVSHFYHFSFV